MTVVAHISDLHFGRDVPELADLLLASLASLSPDLVAVSGDLTQHGRRDEMAAAKRFLDRLPAPALVVPGNHDIPKHPWLRFARPWRRWTEELGRVLEPVVSGRGFVAVGVNTARSWRPHYDWSRGSIRDEQLDTLEREFAAAGPGSLRIVVAHHPFALEASARHRGLVGGARAALPRLRRAGVDLVLGGHVHLGYAEAVGGVVVAQSGTSLSDRLKGELQGFNRIEAARERIAIDHYCASGGDFVRDETAEFVRDAGRGWTRTRATSAGARSACGTSRPSAR